MSSTTISPLELRSASDEQYVFGLVVAGAYFLVFLLHLACSPLGKIWLACPSDMCRLIFPGAEWRHFLKLRQEHFLRRAKGVEGLTSAQAWSQGPGLGFLHCAAA